jgi:predicted Zn finger-like uncharacterized protein
VIVRCEKCQAVFSVQDGLAAAGAPFQVECGRCAQLFQARPLAPPAVEAEAKTPVRVAPVAPDPVVLEKKARADELAKALKPQRPEDAQKALEQELARVVARRRRRVRWALAVFGVAAFTLLALGLRTRVTGMPRPALARVEKARELLLRDDDQSLARANALFTEAARLAPGEAQPEGERGFVMLLQAAARKDLEARLGVAQKELAEKAAAASGEAREKLEQEAAQLGLERENYAREQVQLFQHGVAAAKAALEEDGEDEPALRAMALQAALEGEKDEGALEKAEKIAPDDPWLHYVKAVAVRKEPDAALAQLALLNKAEPRLLRAQVERAALSMDRQEPGSARDTLAQVLQANPQHERAKRMLSLLPAPPQ